MPRIKICGLSTLESLEAAIDAGADTVGFVFVENSSRSIHPAHAKALVEGVGGRADVVGLWQDGRSEDIASVCSTVGLTHVQWHGPVGSDTLTTLRAATGLPVIAAHGVSTESDLGASALAPLVSAETLLFDAKPPQGADSHGGHGRAFDWSVLSAYEGSQPWLLAGGLTPDSVGAAVAAVGRMPGFAGVDVSSGVEQTRGVKDPRLITAFVTAARAAMAHLPPMETRHA